MGGSSTSYSSSRRYNFSDSKDVTTKSASDYAKDDGRTYEGDSSEGIKSPIGKDIQTDSSLAALLMVDQTGSMSWIPEDIFIKIASLYAETNAGIQGLDVEDLKSGKITPEDKLEMAVLAIGDAKSDQQVLQVVDFSKGPDLVNRVNEIYPEGNGGGNAKESYDLAAYYALNHCKTPNVKGKPLLIIIGDEGFYEKVSKNEIKRYIGDKKAKDLDGKKLMKDLANKFDVYLLRPELSYDRDIYKDIHEQWKDVLKPERTMKLNDPHRYVDCIVGCACVHANNLENLVPLLDRRQIDKEDPQEGVEKVRETLTTLHPVLGKKYVDKELKKLDDKYKA